MKEFKEKLEIDGTLERQDYYISIGKAEMSAGGRRRCKTRYKDHQYILHASQSCLPSSEWCGGTINKGE
jgi:hypothetical protein